MEFPRRLTVVERVLTAALLAAVLGVAWLEARSPAAAAIRERRPLAAWLALDTPGIEVPRLYLVFLSPGKGTADVIYVPESTVVSGRHGTLAKAYGVARRQGAARRDAAKATADAAEALVTPALPAGSAPAYFYYDRAARAGGDPAFEGRDWLVEKTRGTGLWREGLLHFGGRKRGFGLDGFELLRLGVELHSLEEDNVRAAYLPEQKELPSYFAALAGAPESAERGETHFLPSVEVLNASGRAGLAADVTKTLRARGFDVLTTGNSQATSFTIVYDRVGHPEVAAKARRVLDCPSARALTQVDRNRAVDVSVVVGDDCSVRE